MPRGCAQSASFDTAAAYSGLSTSRRLAYYDACVGFRSSARQSEGSVAGWIVSDAMFGILQEYAYLKPGLGRWSANFYVLICSVQGMISVALFKHPGF